MKLPSLCLILCLVDICQAAALYGEEGTKVKMTCSITNLAGDTNVSHVLWTARNAQHVGNNTSGMVSQCDTANNCINPYSPTITSIITNTNVSTLTIANLSRVAPFDYNTPWACQLLPKTSVFTQLTAIYIYAKPQSAKCIYQSLNMTTKQVICTMVRIFPEGRCYTYISRNNVSFTSYNARILPTDKQLKGTPIYYMSTCQIQFDLFYIGANYLKVRMSSNSGYYFVDSEIFLLPNVIVQDTATTQSSTTQIIPTQAIEAATPVPSDSGLVFVLGLTTALFGIVAITLAVLMLCYWMRGRKKRASENAEEQAITEVPAGYNSVDDLQYGSELDSDNYYEEVQGQNAKSAEPKTGQRISPKHEPGQYVNTAGTHTAHEQLDQQEPDYYENPIGSSVRHNQHELGSHANSLPHNQNGTKPLGKGQKGTFAPYVNYKDLGTDVNVKRNQATVMMLRKSLDGTLGEP